MKQQRTAQRLIRRVLVSVLVCAVVLGLPLFSFARLGFSLWHPDTRSNKPLPAFQTRYVDSRNPHPVLFQQPLISVTFDDGWETTYTTALPLLQKYGIHTTQYVLAGTSDNQEYLSWRQMGEIQKAGHELACHTVSHPDLTQINDAQLSKELAGCRDALTQRFGVTPDFASPYGYYNDHVVSAIKQYFSSQRNTDGEATTNPTEYDVNLAPSFDRYHITAVTIERDTSVATIDALVRYAKLHNGWLVLVYHQADDGPSKYGIDPQKLEAQLRYLNQTDVPIVTVQQALQSLGDTK